VTAALFGATVREARMGRKKACFGREDYVCLTKNCPYMDECIRAVWDKKVSGMLRRSRKETKTRTASGTRKK
jgi:hypothetical protein